MRKILLAFFFALSIAFLLTPMLQAQDADVGVALLEMQLKTDGPVLDTPGDDITLPPGKYDTTDPDLDTKIVVDNTPTCEEVFAAIDKKQKAGVALSQEDQARREGCIEQTIPEDDDELEESRDNLYSLDFPEDYTETVGRITKIWINRYSTCCPEVRVVCPSCPKGYPGSGPSNGQTVNSSAQPTNHGSYGNTGSVGSSPSTGNTPSTRQ